MAVSYKKLWHMLIDKDMNKTDLCKATGVSNSTIAKMARGEEVSMTVLMKICCYFTCNIGDIVDIDYTQQ